MKPDKSRNIPLDKIIKSLGLDEKEFEKRKAYLQISQEDIDELQLIEPHLRKIHSRIMDEFFTHLLEFDGTARFLQDPDQLTELKLKQSRYFDDLTHGPYDWNYVKNRLTVGMVHQQIGLEPQWYIGAYSKFITSLIPEICDIVGEDTKRAGRIICALLKIVFLDINIVLDTYMTSDQLSLRALKAYSENLFTNIPIGLVVVSSDMRIVSGNDYMEHLFDQTVPETIDQDIFDIFPGTGLRDRAIEVLITQQPQHAIRIEAPVKGQLIPCQVALSPLDISDPFSETEKNSGVLIVFEDISGRELLVQSTAESDDRVRAIMDNVADGIITIDKTGLIESFNKQAESMFGYRATEVLGKNVSMLMPEPDANQHDGFLERYLSSGQKSYLGTGFRQVTGKHKDGNTFDTELAVSQLNIGNKPLFIGIVHDISQRVESEKKMAQLSSAIEQAADSVVITDNKGIIEYVNGGFEQTTGFTRNEVIGKTPAVIKSGLQDDDYYKNLWTTIFKGEIFRDVLINRKKDGSLYYEEKTITPLRDAQNTLTHFIATGKDITERMHDQQRMQFMVHHDSLTLLPNRVLFINRLSSAISTAEQHNIHVALMVLDLDRFKNINDTLGHAFGDRLLQQVAKRLPGCLPESDTVARLSGDEFAILLDDIKDHHSITLIANKITEVLGEPFFLDSHELFISASIGITVAPEDGNDVVTLLKNADIAMYRTKSSSRAYSYYTPDMHTRAEEHLMLENNLRHALSRNEFFLVYQPQVDLINHNQIIGVEALIRWQHPTSGVLLPTLFIPLLEETGYIKQVGEWILDTACNQLRQWLDQGLRIPRISINISPRQISAPGFTNSVITCLKKNHLSPQHLELEITESSLMENEKNAMKVLTNIHHIGINIAMDDFGTGYSSLSYLQKLPVSTLKIDQSFVSEVPNNKDDAELTNTIIAMGQSLNLTVIAEGVENEAQLEFLKQRGCHAVQGFLTGKPGLADEISKFASFLP